MYNKEIIPLHNGSEKNPNAVLHNMNVESQTQTPNRNVISKINFISSIDSQETKIYKTQLDTSWESNFQPDQPGLKTPSLKTPSLKTPHHKQLIPKINSKPKIENVCDLPFVPTASNHDSSSSKHNHTPSKINLTHKNHSILPFIPTASNTDSSPSPKHNPVPSKINPTHKDSSILPFIPTGPNTGSSPSPKYNPVLSKINTTHKDRSILPFIPTGPNAIISTPPKHNSIQTPSKINPQTKNTQPLPFIPTGPNAIISTPPTLNSIPSSKLNSTPSKINPPTKNIQLLPFIPTGPDSINSISSNINSTPSKINPSSKNIQPLPFIPTGPDSINSILSNINSTPSKINPSTKNIQPLPFIPTCPDAINSTSPTPDVTNSMPLSKENIQNQKYTYSEPRTPNNKYEISNIRIHNSEPSHFPEQNTKELQTQNCKILEHSEKISTSEQQIPLSQTSEQQISLIQTFETQIPKLQIPKLQTPTVNKIHQQKFIQSQNTNLEDNYESSPKSLYYPNIPFINPKTPKITGNNLKQDIIREGTPRPTIHCNSEMKSERMNIPIGMQKYDMRQMQDNDIWINNPNNIPDKSLVFNTSITPSGQVVKVPTSNIRPPPTPVRHIYRNSTIVPEEKDNPIMSACIYLDLTSPEDQDYDYVSKKMKSISSNISRFQQQYATQLRSPLPIIDGHVSKTIFDEMLSIYENNQVYYQDRIDDKRMTLDEISQALTTLEHWFILIIEPKEEDNIESWKERERKKLTGITAFCDPDLHQYITSAPPHIIFKIKQYYSTLFI